MTDSFAVEFRPLPSADAIVVVDRLRVTVLTPRLFRIEFDSAEDRPDLFAWYRGLKVPDYSVIEPAANKGFLEIRTDSLVLRYRAGADRLSADTLEVEVRDTGFTWGFGTPIPGNLGGTARTLDGVDGPAPLEDGPIGRQGIAVLDCSSLPVFAEGFLPVPRPERGVDCYVFGAGMNYRRGIADYLALSGPVPLPPRFVFGPWWSKYHSYDQDSYLQLMDDFRDRGIPLSVAVLDMDWHLTDNPYTRGWTGYTWNPRLFPDPPGFLGRLHDMGLAVSLNLHPADGVHPHEEAYPRIAAQLERDPATGDPVRFRITDPAFVRAYFEHLHHPREAEGVDFWWVDWQQGTSSDVPGLDPLWLLNHLHFLDAGRDPSRRPVILSRWAGPGSHRYPLGFSGDAYTTWDSLRFQPYFTATAANVGYFFWSHDIGGHLQGHEDDELYLRWLQFGAYSPIFRLHTMNSDYQDRRPWTYRSDVADEAARVFRLRKSLIPFLYSEAFRASRSGVAPVRPMYHDYPDEEAAYRSPMQYLFGQSSIVAPFTAPADPELRLSRQIVWLPEGRWFEESTGRLQEGGRFRAVYGELSDIPVFHRPGTILPLDADDCTFGVDLPRRLILRLYVGAEGRYELFEDDGLSQHYAEASLTRIHMSPPAPARDGEGPEVELTVRIKLPESGVAAALDRDICLHLVGLRDLHEARLGGRILDRTDPGLDGVFGLETRISAADAGSDLVCEIRGVLQDVEPEASRRRREIEHLVRKARILTWEKEDLRSNIDRLVAQPELFFSSTAFLSGSQRRAIAEILFCGGIEVVDYTGRDDGLLLFSDGTLCNPDFVLAGSKTMLIDRGTVLHHHFIPFSKTSFVQRGCLFPTEGWKVALNYKGMHTVELTKSPA